MAYVVVEPCINCKYTECAAVCPTDCFHEGENFVVINPDLCIDCAACEIICPTKAVFREDEVPDQWVEYIDMNEEYSRVWPLIAERREPMPDAEHWKDVEHKREHLVLGDGPGSDGPAGGAAST